MDPMTASTAAMENPLFGHFQYILLDEVHVFCAAVAAVSDLDELSLPLWSLIITISFVSVLIISIGTKCGDALII